MIYEFKRFIPVVHETAFVHPQANVIGNVTIGKNVYIGPGAAIRGDWGEIIIKDGSNVQENCTIHMFPGTRSLVVGNPAKIIKSVSDKMIEWKTKGTQLYQSLPNDMHLYSKAVEPLRSQPKNKPNQETLFKTWNEIQDS